MSTRIGIGRELMTYAVVVIIVPPVWITLTSGLTVYRRGVEGTFYVLDYSADGGSTWDRLAVFDPTEDNPITDLLNIYRHRIVGTSYRVDQELTPTGYVGTEDIDWENIYST